MGVASGAGLYDDGSLAAAAAIAVAVVVVVVAEGGVVVRCLGDDSV